MIVVKISICVCVWYVQVCMCVHSLCACVSCACVCVVRVLLCVICLPWYIANHQLQGHHRGIPCYLGPPQPLTLHISSLPDEHSIIINITYPYMPHGVTLTPRVIRQVHPSACVDKTANQWLHFHCIVCDWVSAVPIHFIATPGLPHVLCSTSCN